MTDLPARPFGFDTPLRQVGDYSLEPARVAFSWEVHSKRYLLLQGKSAVYAFDRFTHLDGAPLGEFEPLSRGHIMDAIVAAGFSACGQTRDKLNNALNAVIRGEVKP